MHTASYIVYVYAVLVIIGGVIGYTRAQSRPSLIMGVVSGLLLLLAGWGLGHALSWGEPLSIVLIVALLVFFGGRYANSRAFMPSGLMAVLSLLALIGFFVTRR